MGPHPFVEPYLWLLYAVHRVFLHDKTLVEIDFSNKEFPNEDLGVIQKLMESLKQNMHVKKLKLSNCKLQNVDAFALADMLRLNKSLLELDISGNELVANTLVAISEVLKHNKTLLSFNCSGNKGTPRMESSFVELFAKKENITLLQISLPMDP